MTLHFNISFPGQHAGTSKKTARMTRAAGACTQTSTCMAQVRWFRRREFRMKSILDLFIYLICYRSVWFWYHKQERMMMFLYSYARGLLFSSPQSSTRAVGHAPHACLIDVAAWSKLLYQTTRDPRIAAFLPIVCSSSSTCACIESHADRMW